MRTWPLDELVAAHMARNCFRHNGNTGVEHGHRVGCGSWTDEKEARPTWPLCVRSTPRCGPAPALRPTFGCVPEGDVPGPGCSDAAGVSGFRAQPFTVTAAHLFDSLREVVRRGGPQPRNLRDGESPTTAFANGGSCAIGIREGLLRRRLHQRSGTDLLKIAVDDAVALRNASRDRDEAAVGGAE